MTEDGARLWATAQGLARAADTVRRDVGSRVPPMLFLTDPERTPRPWEIAERMPSGSGVIYRSFGSADALETAQRLREVTIRRAMILLIGLDDGLAQRVSADGVHLPERALSTAQALIARHGDWIVTAAVHSTQAVSRAVGLDAVLLSPIFAAGGASGVKPALGLAALTQAATGPTRVIALGGITGANAAGLEKSGAYGLAAIGSLAEAFGP